MEIWERFCMDWGKDGSPGMLAIIAANDGKSVAACSSHSIEAGHRADRASTEQ
jgi:hypothetical protein